MYTQHPRRANVPENYSGNAFRYPPIGSLTVPSDEVKQDDDDVLTKQQDGDVMAASQESALFPRRPSSDEATGQPCPLLALDRKSEERSLFPFNFLSTGHGIGSEELLLIGLFLLLTGGNDEGDEKREKGDLLFYLLLLFFCG